MDPTPPQEPEKYHCSDEELGALLHRLFTEHGEDEVEIHHPTEGVIVYTREHWKKQLEALQRVMDMSPAERLQEQKRQERKQQIKFRTAIIKAKTHTVDIEDEDNFGIDVDGNKIDMDSMIFMRAEDYPKRTTKLKDEIGCFVDESMRKPPIRILALQREAEAT